MHILILAAGYGSRLTPFLNDLPKPLLTLNTRGDSCLSLMLDRLEQSNFQDIHIVGGYRIEKIQDFLDLRTKNIHRSYGLIDACPEFQKGPLYSLLAAQKLLCSQDFFGLFPGDTVFNQKIYRFLEVFNQNQLKRDGIHVFCYKSSKRDTYGQVGIQIKQDSPDQVVESFNSLASNTKPTSDRCDDILIMIPFLVLPGTIFNVIPPLISPADTTVFHILQKICENAALKIFAHLIPDVLLPFKDLDKKDDISIIQRLIEDQNCVKKK
ncbi:MAG: NTP transferase domain-containing protein [Promethearchaeota archaeon]